MSDSKEIILARLLASISNSYDTTVGSFFYDLAMAVSIELEISYANQDQILNDGFADTAVGTFLDRLCAEQGLTRNPASFATTLVTINGTIGATINIGDKVATDVVNFVSLENHTLDVSGTVLVNVQCQNSGIVGNVPIGAIKNFPITLQGITSVTNLVAVTNGYDAETDTSLRTRYYLQVQTPSTSGNIAHYIQWAQQVLGIGAVQIYPLWNGAGTVKICAIDTNSKPLTTPLLTALNTYVESQRPIGATVTYETATTLLTNINVNIVLVTGFTALQIQTAIIASITSYLASIAFIQTTVSYAKVGSLILGITGVADYNTLTLNSGVVNITIPQEQVALIGSVTVG